MTKLFASRSIQPETYDGFSISPFVAHFAGSLSNDIRHIYFGKVVWKEITNIRST